MSPDARPERPTPIALVLAAWAIVAAPLVWGVVQTIAKSAPLFR